MLCYLIVLLLPIESSVISTSKCPVIFPIPKQMIGVDADNKSSQDVDNGSQIPWFCTSVGLGFQYRNLGSLQSFSASEATCLSRKHF